jgi:F-type H+-transporting ATPase subunit b
MLIDWFTLSAQVVNFIILVLLLKFLLFKRVLKALDEREDEIAKRLQLAHGAKAEADQHQKTLRGEVQAYELARKTRMKALESEIEEIRKERSKALQAEAELDRSEWQASLREHEEHFLEKLKSLALRHLTKSMREAIDALADSDLETLLTRAFVKHLRELPEEEQRAFLEGVPINGDTLEVESRFMLEAEQRSWLSEQVQNILHYDGEVRFLTKEQPGCGIKLRMAGRTVEWSLDHYFDDMVDQLREHLQDDLHSETAVAA